MQPTRQRRRLAVASVRTTLAVKKTASKNEAQRVPAPTRLALQLLGHTSKTDVNGSYTGVPKNKHEKPVQDADDL